MEASELQSTVFDVFTTSREQGLMFAQVEDLPLDGRLVRIEGRDLVSFGSCSYLGLEMDPRIRAGVKDAVERYGTQFSASRAYLSAPPYRDIEESLSELFGSPTIVTSSTTLGHLGIIPVLCQERDAIILDQQVHHSVQLGATLARAVGCHVEMVRHGDTLDLEERIAALCKKHRAVWYCLDGVYSMYGDLPDVAVLKQLLDRYGQLHLYVDDAHGMSIAGRNGRGMHLSRMAPHPRMVVATSLNKAFAASGGCVVLPTEAMRDRVRLCASTLAFCGPIQPPMLGAIRASAAIHLSPEITRIQSELSDRVSLFNRELTERGLPLLAHGTPICFIKTGPLKLARALITRMMHEGFYVTVATYPAVPMKRSGLRISLTRHHRMEDLKSLAAALEHHYPLALDEVNMSREQVEGLFSYLDRIAEKQREKKLEALFEFAPPTELRAVKSGPAVRDEPKLTVTHARSIHELDAAEWDRMLGGRSNFDHRALAMLEQTFRGRAELESNWRFHYLVVREDGRPVAATFLTEALWKDDMLMRAEVSRKIEEKRAQDPYFLTSPALSMGCLLTEGDHLYLDRTGPWQQALTLLLDEAASIFQNGLNKLFLLRDLPGGDPELDSFLLEHGFVKMPVPSGHRRDLTSWSDEAGFLKTLGQRTRRRVRADVLDTQGLFTTRIYRHDGERPSAADFAHFHVLYQNVKSRKLRLNTFELPPDIFERLWETPGWEVQTLHLSPEAGGPADGRAVALGASYMNGKHSVALVCGTDGVQREVSVYRQLLWRTMLRAKELGMESLELGMDAEVEKARMGCEQVLQCAYVQLSDHFNAEIMGQVVQDVSLAPNSLAVKSLAKTG